MLNDFQSTSEKKEELFSLQIKKYATSQALQNDEITNRDNSKIIKGPLKTKIKKKILKIVKPFLYSPAKFIRNFLNRDIQSGLHQLQQNLSELHKVQSELQQNQNEHLKTLIDLHRKADEAFIVIGRNRSFIVFEKENKVLINAHMGYLFCALDDALVLMTLINLGDLEKGTRLFIGRFLKPGDTYIDIGANYGVHVLVAYHALKGQGKIIAFEPFPRTFQLLKESIKLNHTDTNACMIELHQKAVSNQNHPKTLFLGQVSGHHSLYPLANSQEEAKREIIIETVRLDDVINPTEKINLIKIDVEGAELNVLEGAKNTLINNPNIALIVEFGPSHIKRVGYTVDEWLKKFSDLGFSYLVINEMDGTLESWSLEKLTATVSVNLFFARKNSAIWDSMYSTVVKNNT